ncbi:MAG: HEAT repeat domain-containing protein [Desulfobacteraceae bacterium]|nr:MAG: HEAT repeat domain-containing protein [Desulfobacteraceae bacterium]
MKIPLIFIVFIAILILGKAEISDVAAEEPQAKKDAATAVDYTRDTDERIAAIQRLGTYGERDASGPLIAILLDRAEEQGLRACAARALGEVKADTAEALKALEEVYREPGAGSNLRYTILMTLGNMKEHGAIVILKDALSDGDAMIRFKSLQALGNLGLGDAVEIIMQHLEKETDRLVRAEGARALGSYNSDVSQGCLAGLLISDPEAVVRLNAALSLLKFDFLMPGAESALKAAREDVSIMVREAVKGVKP